MPRSRLSNLPRALPVVLALVAGEALLLVGAAVVAVRAALVGEVTSTGLTAGVVLLSLGVAALLLAAGRALLQGRRWGRAPVVTWQLLQLAVAVPVVVAAVQPVLLALLVASVVVLVGLFTPAVVAHTTVGEQPPAL